jgi:excisionase family DNA binding protein
MGKTLSITEVAKHFYVDYQTVWRWVKYGKLPAFKTPGGQWRVREEDVLAIEEREGV